MRTSTDLDARAHRLLGDGPWAVATVTSDGTDLAARGIPLDGRVEIGSISKGVTGLLYADAIARGEVDPGDRLSVHLPLGGSPAGDVTLAALATHRSGLPPLPDKVVTRRTVKWLAAAQNPYGDTLCELLDQTRSTRLRREKSRYSNLGFQLLGHAVAAAAGTTYRRLVQERIAAPLGLTSLTVPHSTAELGPDDVDGLTRFGRVSQAWTGEGLGPAGGIRMSIADAGRLAGALLDGSAPGVDAIDPVAELMGPAIRIGAGWITSQHQGSTVTWHNGQTGGFRSWLGVDLAGAAATVVVRGRVTSTDRPAFRLLSDISALRWT